MGKRVGMVLALGIALLLVAGDVLARDWYVSVTTGKGKDATKEKPAKDLGNISDKIEGGDRVLIAEGVYLGRGENGIDLLKVPVEILGGWDTTFTKRDPWGAHRTVLTGNNTSKNFDGDARLIIDCMRWTKGPGKIVVEGIIFDNGPRNNYSGGKTLKIVRMASPKEGKMPTPESGAIVLKAGDGFTLEVRNCVAMNCAPTDGVIALWGYKNATMTVENCLAINNTGNGFAFMTAYHPDELSKAPVCVLRNCTSLFNEKHDPIATYGGSGVKFDTAIKVTLEGNVFACNDYYGIDNGKSTKDLVLKNNLFASCLQADYREFDTSLSVDVLEDEAKYVATAEGNVAKEIKVPVSAEWAQAYAARQVIDRNVAEADVKVVQSKLNGLRSLLGLPVQGTDLKVDSDVWLPLMTVEDALKAGAARYEGTFGCQTPAAQ